MFETQGDRRLGTHLISPMEILFLNLFEFPQALEEHFKSINRLDNTGLTELLIDF